MNSNNKGIFRTIASNFMRPSAQGVITGIIVHLGIMFLAYQLYLTKASQNELSLINQGNKIKYEIEKVFNKKIAALSSIALSINHFGEIDNFDEVASEILQNNSRLRTIALLPQGKYEHIYPLNDSTKKVLGFDLMKNGDKRMVSRIKDGIDNHQVVFAGPFPNSIYDTVVTGLYPIFLHKKFWGLCVITIPIERILTTIDTVAMKRLNIFITNIDPISKTPYTVYSKVNDADNASNKNSYSEKILHNNWRLHIVSPKTGWIGILIIPYLVSLILAILVGTYVNGMVYAKRKLGGAEEALKRYDLKFRSIFENAPIGIAQIDFETRKLTEVNKKFSELAGLKSNDLVGKGLWEILPPKFYEKSFNEFQQILQKGGSQLEKLFKHRGSNGSEAWVHATLKPIVEDNGKINTHVLVVEDITDAERAKQALTDSEVRYRSLFEDSPIALWEFDFSGVKSFLTEKELLHKDFDYLSSFFREHPQQFRQCFQQTRVLSINNKAVELHEAENKHGMIAAFWAMIEEPKAWDLLLIAFAAISNNEHSLVKESVTFTRKFEPRNITYYWNVMPGSEKDFKHVLIATPDITKAKKAEAEIKQAKDDVEKTEKRFRALFEDSPIALWEHDYREVKKYLESIGLMNKSLYEITDYFSTNTDHLRECYSKIIMLDYNKAAIDLYGMNSEAELDYAQKNAIDYEDGWEIIFIALAAVSNSWTKYSTETNAISAKGKLVLHYEWNVMPGFEDNFGHVIVGMVDITQLKQSQMALEQANKLLEISEDRHRSLFEDSPVALWEQDFSGLRQYFIEKDLMHKTYDEIFNYFVTNPDAFDECFELFGIYAVNKSGVNLYDAASKDELMNNVKFLLSSPASMEYTVLALTSVSNEVLSSKHETTIYTLSGKVKHIDYRFNVAPGYEHDFSRVIVAMNDITKLKEAELDAQEAARALQVLQRRFRSLFENSPIALWEEDYSGVKSYIVQKELWGKSPEFIRSYFETRPQELYKCIETIKILSVNKEALKIYNAEDIDKLRLAFDKAIHQPESWEVFLVQVAELGSGKLKLRKETTSVNDRGETLYLDLNWNVLPGYEETLERVIVSTNDITQITQSQREIEAARSRLETIINTVDGIIWTADPVTLRYTFVSDNAMNITGYPKEVWTNKTDFQNKYMLKKDADNIAPKSTANIEAGTPGATEYQLVTKDGSIKWFREAVNFIKHDGKIVSLIGIIVDITDLRNAKDNLQHSLDIVSKQNQQLMQFSYIVSHNLRSHIGNINSLCELLKDPETGKEEQAAYIDHLHNISKILNDTMDGLNEVTHIQTTANLTVKQLNIKEFINKTLTILSNVISEKKATIVTEVGPDAVVNYYQPYLESVLLGFTSNALKYSSPKRPPLLTIHFDNKEKTLTFKDNGIGIDLDQHGSKIFGLFKKFTSNPDSRGIGLYIAKNQIEAMGGRVTVDSKIDVGTTFKIYFNG